MLHYIGLAQNKHQVHVNLLGSRAAKRISRDPNLATLAVQVLNNTILDKPTLEFEQDMGRLIGYDLIVQTADADTVFYAQQTAESFYTRFTKSGKPRPTRFLSMALHYDQDEEVYILDDIWIGQITPARPGSVAETDASKPFWQDHAFVYDNQSIQLRSLTKTCPY